MANIADIEAKKNQYEVLYQNIVNSFGYCNKAKNNADRLSNLGKYFSIDESSGDNNKLSNCKDDLAWYYNQANRIYDTIKAEISRLSGEIDDARIQEELASRPEPVYSRPSEPEPTPVVVTPTRKPSGSN